jgi:multidrug/hemolysin transport system permease protein
MITQLIKRNLLVFFRDKSSVFFSLLSVFIIIGLYALFLGDVMESDLESLGNNVQYIISTWIMAGILSVTTITTCMGALGIMVEDRAKNTLKDFTVSPIRRSAITGSYILSAFIISVVMSLIALVIAVIYILSRGGEIYSVAELIRILGVILLSVISNGSIILFIVVFFKSLNAYSVASTIIGTIIGFLMGIYIPIGNLPSSVQTFIKFFPPSHSAALFRDVMMNNALSNTFSGAPEQTLQSFREYMGISLPVGTFTNETLLSIFILIGTAIVFFTLSVFKMSKRA